MSELIEKARAANKPRTRAHKPTDEELGLALAFANGEFTAAAVDAAVGNKAGAHVWAGGVLLRAIRFGMLKAEITGNPEQNGG